MKKKIFVIFLLTWLIIMTGCNNIEPKEDRITVSWRGTPNSLIDADSETERYIEDKYNINIEIINTSSDENLSSILASGQIPDVMFLSEPAEWQSYARQNILAPLTLEQIKENAPNQYTALSNYDQKIWVSGMDNDVLWVIPQLAIEEKSFVGILRKDWMENLGIDFLPSSIEEYEYIFDLFTNGDPDRNGKNDTYAFTGMGGHQVRQFDAIFGAFGIMPGQWRIENGQVYNDTINPKAKEVLQLLNKWYQKGYIHPECVTDTVDSAKHKFISGKVGITFDSGSLYDENSSMGAMNIADMRSYNNQATVCFSYLPMGPDGNSGNFGWGPRANFVGFGKQLSEKKDLFNKILEILDDLNYDEETVIRQYWGIKDVHHSEEKQGEIRSFKYIGEYTDPQARKKVGLGGYFNLFSTSGHTPFLIEEPFKQDGQSYLFFTEYSQVSFDDLCRPSLPSSSKLQTKLDNYKSISYSKFIIGERPLEEWDSFVDEYLNMGGAILMEEAQKLYEENFVE